MLKIRHQSALKRTCVAIGVLLFASTAIAGAMKLTNPGRGNKSTFVTLPEPSPTPSPTASVQPTPTPTAISGTVDFSSSIELASIPTNFDTSGLLVPSWGTGAIAPSNAPDVVGGFRFICAAGQLLYDDPIVYPGQPGRSHLHQFFGNTAANASSTYQTLRGSGESTCNNALNRSAYWIPAMMDGAGGVVRPDYVSIYYKRRPKSDPVVSDPNHPQYMGKAVDLPRGLRYIFGYNMSTMSNPTGAFHFNCEGAGAVSGHFATITEAAKGCPTGARLGAVIVAPDCWDGKNLDSPDHRSHMAYPDWGTRGYLKCPATHPFVIPAFTLGAWYSVDANRATWHLSSDVMPGMPRMPAGSTMHADWFGAWDDNVLAMWHANCIDKMLSCTGGDLGNGRQLRQDQGYTFKAEPRVVPVPSL